MSKVYTRNGDGGETRMKDGTKTDKASCNSEAIGDIDELNSNIGLCISFINKENIIDNLLISQLNYLTKIQKYLFNIGTIIASPKNKDSENIVFDVNKEITYEMENRIDILTNHLPCLKNFIAPTGTVISSQLHISRAVCRRAERHMKALINQTDNNYIKINCSSFMNRLSDYLFTLARYINYVFSTPEIIINHQGSNIS